jgi:uncharacterized protein (UPF0261 family)
MTHKQVAGVIGVGGSGGTALITAAMRALPIGVPKVMVSTVASGNTAPYVGTSNLIMVSQHSGSIQGIFSERSVNIQ